MADYEGKTGSVTGKESRKRGSAPSRFQGQKAQDVSPIWRKTTHDSAMSLSGG